MKKALHDALGYLWVKNSLEADKKRKQEIASENGRIEVAISNQQNYQLCVAWWGTTELGYTGITFVFPDEIKWLPKEKMIEVLKANPGLTAGCGGGIWWNPKFGNMEDFFTEEEMKRMRYGIQIKLEAGQRSMGTLASFDETNAYQKVQTEEIIKGTLPRTTFEDVIKNLKK